MTVGCREQAGVGAGGTRVPQHVANGVIGFDLPAGSHIAQHGTAERRIACEQQVLRPLRNRRINPAAKCEGLAGAPQLRA